jgi:hypothetical protein
MIFLSIGLPGMFAEWCDALLGQLARRTVGSAEIARVNTLEDLALAAMKTEASHLIASARKPGGSLRKTLSSLNSRFLIALGDPRSAVAELVMRHGMDLPTATRDVASGCASLLAYGALPGSLSIRVDQFQQNPMAVAEAVCKHFGTAADPAEIAKTLETQSNATIALSPWEVDAWWSRLGAAERGLVAGALDAYTHYWANGELKSMTWSRELFFIGDAPHERATRGIDITGRARCLLYGPYIMLPPGSWTALVEIGCSRETAGMSFMVEVFSGSQLGRTTLHAARGGIYDASLGFVVEELVDHVNEALQIRIFNDRAAFDGRLGLGKVTVIRQARTPRHDREDFAAILGLDLQ